MTELTIGKYKFYPYELERERTATLEELKELLRKQKAGVEKSGKGKSRPKDRAAKD